MFGNSHNIIMELLHDNLSKVVQASIFNALGPCRL